MTDVKESARHFRDTTRDAAAVLRDDLESVARRAGYRVHELTDSAENSLTDASEVMTSKIRQNPLQSSLIALGAGFLIGMLYKR